jgi:hypothetical protein
MDNIASVKAGFAEQAAIFKHKHQWLMSWLYIGTFGSFIGLAAGFPMLVNTVFPGVDAFQFAFIGPLLAAFVRPIGGWLADRLGGAIITFGIFADHGGGAAGRYRFPAGGARRGQRDRFRGHVPGAVPRRRHRQRFHVPHDPDHLPHPARAPGDRPTTRRRWNRHGATARPKPPPPWGSARRSLLSAGSSFPSPTASPSN